MKRVLIVLAITFVSFLSAQNLKYGAKIGMNAATLSNIENAEARMAFHIGAMVEFQVSDKFYVQPELLYSAQGADIQTEEGEDVGFDLSYVTIPVMAKYYIKNGFSLQAGPYASFLISSSKGRGEEKDAKQDMSDFFNGLDYGVGVGMGYILPNSLSFDLRYNVGMADLWRYPEDNNNKKTNNGVFQLAVGYFF